MELFEFREKVNLKLDLFQGVKELFKSDQTRFGVSSVKVEF